MRNVTGHATHATTGVLAILGVAASLAACGPGANAPDRSPLADKWLARAQASYKGGDVDDALHAARAALDVAPKDPEIRMINARIALASLEFARALKLTEGIQSTDAHGIRGRAHWYSGDIEAAADELEAELRDPSVRDPWARDIAGLARRGVGRHPFELEGGVVVPIEMPRAAAALVVPCELEGERILAMVATASGEVIVDSNSRREPAWVNLRFGDRIEVKDVPALTQDLSGLSRQLGAPVKALLGVNLLRHLHATFDRRGDQFVVCRQDPPAPPDASRVPLFYVRGGGMLMRAQVSPREDGNGMFLVDSSQAYLLALTDPMWRKAGVDPARLAPEPAIANAKSGAIPQFRLGGFDLPQVPAVSGVSIAGAQQGIDVELGGVMGAPLLSAFRVTFGDDGRYIWMEPDPSMAIGGREPPPPAPGAPATPPAKPAPSGAAPAQPAPPPGAGKPASGNAAPPTAPTPPVKK